MLTRDDLARAVIRVMDLQKRYWRLKRGEPGKDVALEESMKAERELRRECSRILEGDSLFPEENA